MCTNITLPANSVAKIAARTMDFGIPFNSAIHIMQKGLQLPADYLRPAKNPLTWYNRYGYISVRMMPKPDLADTSLIPPGCWDGMNEKGLSVAVLWQPCATFEENTGEKPALHSVSVADYLLGTCATVDDAITELQKIQVCDWTWEKAEISPLHWIIQDPTQNKVVEYAEDRASGKAKLFVYDCPKGTMCNAPLFPQNIEGYNQAMAASKYGFSVYNTEKMDTCNHQEINGSGMIDLPGDATPPSRFIHAMAFQSAKFSPKNHQEATNWGLQLLNTMQVPRGTCLKMDQSGKEADYTQWSVLRDYGNGSSKNFNFYFFSQFNPTLQKIELSKVDWTQHKVLSLTDKIDWSIDVTEKLHVPIAK